MLDHRRRVGGHVNAAIIGASFDDTSGSNGGAVYPCHYDGSIWVERAELMTRDAGLLPFRELDEAFRLTEKGSLVLSDCRRGKNTQHTMLALLRQGVYGRLAGYENVNDAERLRVDLAMRRVVGGRAKEKGAASSSEMSRFETPRRKNNRTGCCVHLCK